MRCTSSGRHELSAGPPPPHLESQLGAGHRRGTYTTSSWLAESCARAGVRLRVDERNPIVVDDGSRASTGSVEVVGRAIWAGRVRVGARRGRGVAPIVSVVAARSGGGWAGVVSCRHALQRNEPRQFAGGARVGLRPDGWDYRRVRAHVRRALFLHASVESLHSYAVRPPSGCPDVACGVERDDERAGPKCSGSPAVRIYPCNAATTAAGSSERISLTLPRSSIRSTAPATWGYRLRSRSGRRRRRTRLPR